MFKHLSSPGGGECPSGKASSTSPDLILSCWLTWSVRAHQRVHLFSRRSPQPFDPALEYPQAVLPLRSLGRFLVGGWVWKLSLTIRGSGQKRKKNHVFAIVYPAAVKHLCLRGKRRQPRECNFRAQTCTNTHTHGCTHACIHGADFIIALFLSQTNESTLTHSNWSLSSRKPKMNLVWKTRGRPGVQLVAWRTNLGQTKSH